MKKIIINKYQIYYAEKIIKKDNSIKLINAKQEIEGILLDVGDLLFPNISNINNFKLEGGQDWDISEEDEQALYQLDIDYRLSKLELNL